MKKYMPLEGLRWSRDSGSTLCDTPQNGRSRTGWGGDDNNIILIDSFGNEPKKEDRKNYILKKR